MKVNKKFMRRITSLAVVVVLAMSLSLFSVTAYAETLNDFSINFDYALYHPNTGDYYSRIDVDIENYSTYRYEHDNVGGVPMDYAMQMVFTATIENNNGSLLLKSGEAFDLSISGLSLWVLITEQNLYKWNGVPASMFVGLVHTDGTWTHLRDVNWVYSSRTDTHAIEVSGITDKDVSQIVFYEEINQYTVTGVHGVRTASLGMGGVGIPTAIEVEIQSKEVGLLEDIGDELTGVNDKLEDQGEKLDQLPDKMGDEFEGVIEQEKEESKQEGNNFVDQVLDKLPDPSQGVLSALGELTSAVGYTGTEAVIPFPAIVVPGIDGLFEDIVIYDGSDFDLGSCVSYIPEIILIVIQSLFTIAIVLYCVYELKGIISFIFTLKEKNNG